MFGIGFGQIDISHKITLEWVTIANTLLYFLSFRIDFKKCEMGVQIDEWGTQNQQQNQQALAQDSQNPYIPSQAY